MCRPFTLEPICTMRAVHVTQPYRSHCWYCCSQCQILHSTWYYKGLPPVSCWPRQSTFNNIYHPFGRFKYLRAPYGISSISEHYNRHIAEALADLSGFHRIVDDIVNTINDHIAHARDFLQHCADKQIALNPQKCIFGANEVTFTGFWLSQEGYQVDKSITDAILQFPKPTNCTELRSFFGLANQLSSSVDTIAILLTPLRPLLSVKKDFPWSDDHDAVFTATKDALTTAPVLSYYNASKPSHLCMDASWQGLGFILQQQSNGTTWNLIQAGSYFLTDTEYRYATIELDILAVCWAVMKYNLFLAGLQHFSIIIDHNPLMPISTTIAWMRERIPTYKGSKPS